MVDQTSLEQNGTRPASSRGPSASAGVRNGVGEVLSDIVSLGELQMQLLSVDARETMQRAQSPISLFVAGTLLVCSAFPVLLIALAEGLYQHYSWDRWLAYSVSGAAAIVVGGIVLVIARGQWKSVSVPLARSQVELAENVRWIKYALTRGSRPPR